MNIIFIGFMGSGKSTIGRHVANALSMNFIDMDEVVVKKSGRKSIGEIFEKDGETTFRELEIIVAREIKHKKNTVIATGGGIIMNKIILDHLKETGKIIFLSCSFPSAVKRIQKPENRPLLNDMENAENLFNIRMPLYNFFADMVIETDNKEINNLVNEILMKGAFE